MVSIEKAYKVIQALTERHLTIGSVESLTGGLFASSLCSVPGASKVLKGGFVTYTPEAKHELVGVSLTDIDRLGVVSEKVATEMAVGGLRRLKVDVAVSFTGNAGPTAEPGEAPVGRVEMCIATKKGHVSMGQDFSGTRNEIREKAVEMMLDALISIYA